MKFDVIIIGTGLGSLLCGYILGKEGFSVCLLEKQPQPGGNLQTFIRHGNKFDTGVHYIGAIGPGQTLARYWNYFGLMKNLPLQQLDPNGFDRVAFGETEFPLAQGFDNFSEQLINYFPGRKNTLDEYLGLMKQVIAEFPLYNHEFPGVHNEHHHASQSARAVIEKTGDQAISKSGIPLSAVLSGNNYLYGGSSATPLHVASLINHSFITGAYRITGGSDIIWRSLVDSIQSQGGKVMTRHEVTSIERIDQKFLIKAGNRDPYMASLVISGIHPAKTMTMLPVELVRTSYRSRLLSLKNTTSSFILFLSLKPGIIPYLNYNSYYHTSINCWDESNISKPGWPSMYLLSTGSSMPSPVFAETVTILTYMQFEEVAQWAGAQVGKRGQDYVDFKLQKAEKLLELVFRKFPELKGAIDHMEISTPLTYQDYTGIPEGSLYGIERDYRNPLMTSVLPNTKIPNFYFTGQNTNLHGVLGVTIGAVATCGNILGPEYLMKKMQNG